MKIFKRVMIFILVVAIAALGFLLYKTTTELQVTKAELADISFTEGQIIEASSGGIVTVSLKKSIYFKNDAFVTDSKAVGSPLSEIFCELHNSGKILGFNNSLVKLEYTKKIIVQDGSSEKTFYLVGDYYVSLQK